MAGLGVKIAEAGALFAANAGVTLFSYNRSNYSYDQKLHFDRYTAAQNQAIAQTGQYRQDIADLTELTCKRMDIFHTVQAMGLTILTAFFCPGRLGLHTSAPPSWLMSLFHTNMAGSYLFMILGMWLSMHALMRANAASTHMLTRFVRLPVPSQKHLDKARKLLMQFEEQPFSEALRVPIIMRHMGGGRRTDGGYNEDANHEVDPEAERRTRHGHDVPVWYKKERHVDDNHQREQMITTAMPAGARGNAPEHFEVYREIQNEWWPYDVYTRICMFLGALHMIQAWAFFQIGHQLMEVRALWAACIVTLCLFMTMQIILTLDVLPGRNELNFLRVGPFAPVFALFGCAFEYSHWYSNAYLCLSVICVCCAYIIMVGYTLWLIKVCAPDWESVPDAAEVPAGVWWPTQWRLPSAFQHAVWLVAPPRQIEAGMTDLPGELRNGANAGRGGAGAVNGIGRAVDGALARDEQKRDVHRALGASGESPAWRMVYWGLLAMLFAWVWLSLGYIVEVANQGTDHPSILNAPALPNNARDPRYRPQKPGKGLNDYGLYHEPVEVGVGGWVKAPGNHLYPGHPHRRLDGSSNEAFGPFSAESTRHELAEKLRDLVPQLQTFVNHVHSQTHAAQDVAPLVAVSHGELSKPQDATTVEWPPLFEPRLLVSGPAGDQDNGHIIAALSRHGRGAVIVAPVSSTGYPVKATPFSLQGVIASGMILAASWDELGLHLLTSTGTMFECLGKGPSSGRWPCNRLDVAKFPLGLGAEALSGAVAISRVHTDGNVSPEIRAAIISPGESTVMLLSSSGGSDAPWRPTGEVSVRSPVASIAFAGDTLLLSSSGGAVTRMQISDGTVSAAAAARDGGFGDAWQSVSGLSGSGVARLGQRKAGVAMDPMLFLGQ